MERKARRSSILRMLVCSKLLRAIPVLGISIAASEDACTVMQSPHPLPAWPARRTTLQRIRGALRALRAPSCEGQTR
jgi:hypothetical protein